MKIYEVEPFCVRCSLRGSVVAIESLCEASYVLTGSVLPNEERVLRSNNAGAVG